MLIHCDNLPFQVSAKAFTHSGHITFDHKSISIQCFKARFHSFANTFAHSSQI
jgi:hypothetical protein